MSQARLRICWAIGMMLLLASFARACPFCVAIKPTFAQQRETAVAVVLGEFQTKSADIATFNVHRVWPNADRVNEKAPLAIRVVLPAKPSGLFLLLAQGDIKDKLADWEWSAVAVDEVTMGYYVRTPDLRTKNAERLRYFAKYLEHADAGVADDAFDEFGHAPYPDVAAVAENLPMAKLRTWLTDPAIPEARKGFFGMALGLATDKSDRAANAKLLRSLIAADKSDFRAGFDGQLAGLLLLEGETGLKLLSERILANPQAAVGDIKHAQSALRFCQEFGQNLSTAQLAAATRPLLARPDAAAAAIVDLARWKDWEALPHVVGLWEKTEPRATDIRRAIVGYLTICPLPTAARELTNLRQRDPTGVNAAEAALHATTGGK